MLRIIMIVVLFHCLGMVSYASDSSRVYVNLVIIQGNKVTKPYIILREITVKEGATYSNTELTELLKTSRQNLMNTSLFNFVTPEQVITGKDTINIVFNLIERWYTWPFPIFEIADRNFNAWWEDKDLGRLNYGCYLVRENFRGRKESLRFKARFGFSEQYGFNYTVPFINKAQRIGLGAGMMYSRNNEIILKTVNNKTLFYKNPDEEIRRELNANFGINRRTGIYQSQTLTMRYNKVMVGDTVSRLNPEYLLNDPRRLEYLGISLLFRDDHRNIKAYPLTGYYADIEFNKLGLGIFDFENVNLFNIQTSLRYFTKHWSRIYLSESLRIKVSGKARQPYYIQRGLGYGDYVRGYEYYVIDGQDYYLFKAAMRYELIRPRTEKLSFISTTKFSNFHYAVYTGVFFDGGYVVNRYPTPSTSLANTFLPGTGISLDYVTYYDSVLRLEYSLNKMGEHGFFIHMVSPF